MPQRLRMRGILGDVLTNDLHRQLRSVVWARGHILNLAQREHSINNFAKDDVFSVEEVALCSRDEELHSALVSVTAGWSLTGGSAYLTPVRIGTGVRLSDRG